MNILVLTNLLLIPISTYIWLAMALLTKRARAATYTVEFETFDYHSDIKTIPSFTQENLDEEIVSFELQFWGTDATPNNIDLYIYFYGANTSNDVPYCYILNDNLGATSGPATLGSASAPVIVSSLGTVDPTTGSGEYNTNVYSWLYPSCMAGFRLDQPIYLYIDQAVITGAILTIETTGGDAESNSLIAPLALSLAPAFML